MKKKILSILITILTACMLMLTLSACGDKTPQITGITVSGQAEVYIDEFDYADYTITATYDNGTTENVTLQAEHLSAEDNAKLSTVGTHTLNVTYSGKTATLSLTVKNHDFDGVTFDNKTVTYNGLPQTIEILGLPLGANVNYSPNNTYTEVGEYSVTATITKQYYNDMQLTATLKITDIIRKITFVQEGVEDIVKEVVDGGTLSKNEIPTPQEVNGYEVKWNHTDFTNITSNVTVEIEKTLKTYTITYVLNGGTNYINNPKEFTIESPTLTLYTPSKEIGATFAGWYTNSAFTDESKITEIKHGSYGNKTIYAKWLDYRIENADGFAIDYKQQPALVSMTVPYTTENIDLNSRFMVSKGCTWKLYSDFMGNYEFPLKAMTLSVGENKAYIIVFHPDGEHFTRYLLNIYRLDMKEYAFMNGLSVWDDGEIQERSELSAPTTNPEKTGYTFGGWAVDGNKVEFPYTVTEDVMFTAIFIPIEYDIVYYLNNGELNTNKTKYTIEQYFTFDTPTRDYYDFSGWFNNANFDGNAITGVSIGTYGKINLYAKWTPIDYVIDYEENGGTNDDNNPTEYNVETATITLKNPTKDGYTFIGWYKEITFNTKVTQIVKGSHGNIKLYAKWTENVNGLNFDGNGNTSGSMTAIALKTGETKAIPLNTFVKTGYTFKGWSTSANGSVVYNDGANYTMGTASQYTIYAVWEANLNALTFNGNGNTGGSTNSMQIRSDASKTLNANGFTRTKYLFAGWAETANGAVKYLDGASYTMGTNASYTLYAVWTLNENEITFNGNGNTSGSMPNQTVYNNGNKVLNDNTFVKTGYHFIGWAESADGAVKYTDGATATFVQKENYTLYAKWEANLNTLTFNGNGNTGGSTNSMQIRSDASATLNQNGFTKNGYTFKGWSTSKNGEVEYLNGASYTMGLNASYTLYAVWEENVNGLNFDGNGNTSGSMSAIALKTGETKAIPSNTFVKTGYHFIGWAESKDGEVVYNNGETYTMGTNSQYTLYAVWEANLNTLIFNGNGATGGTMSSMQIRSDASKALNSNGFTRTGYVFDGWSTTENGAVVYEDGETYLMGTDSENTLYAVWVLNENIIVFNGNGATSGTMDNQIIYKDGSIVIQKNEFHRTGYHFIGWAESTDGDMLYDDESTIIFQQKEIYTLYAVWVPNVYNITYVLNGGTNSTENKESFTILDLPLKLDNAKKIGHTFNGWFSSEDFSNSAILEIVELNNITIYADWIEGSEGITYKLTNLEYSVMEYNGSDTDVVIPTTYKGYPVTSIGEDAFYKCTSLTSIKIGENVKSIGKWAFYECTKLLSVEMPNSITKIGSSAFRACKSLTSVVISENVTSIGNYAFSECYKLTNVILPSAVTTIGDCAFSACSSLSNIEIQNSKLDLGNNVFSGCNKIIKEQNGLKYIRANNNDYFIVIGVVDDKQSQYKIEFGATIISDYAFSECTSLTNIQIPNSVISLGDYAFLYCASLKTIVFDQNSSMINIGNGAFGGCESLLNIEVPNSVTDIGYEAFWGCSNLTSVTIGSNVTFIGEYAFYECIKLTTAKFVNPQGWTAYCTAQTTGETTFSLTLTNETRAAELLSSVYDDYYIWRRT